MSTDIYRDPLVSRYTSRHMQELFSEQTKFKTWRRCWIALSESQRELGLTDIISEEAIKQMREFEGKINFETAQKLEKELRHDVMAHVHAFAKQCPAAAPIIHLGATSQFVGCNTDLIIQKKALEFILSDLVLAIKELAGFVEKTKDIPVLGATHFQPAQPVTLGKRFALGLQDLIMDLESVEWVLSKIHARSTKGTTGTQASFLNLFKGDEKKVFMLEKLVAEKLGFEKTYPVTGQTYPRKLDTLISQALSGIGASANWIAVNIRLMSGLKELDEPFGKKQIGSSAMAYKRNPMRSERICALARKLMNLPVNFHATHANQWMERTLDDSAIRRMDIAQAFLLTDAILGLLINIAGGLIPNHAVMKKRLDDELSFMATEEILIECVERGGDRQKVHEAIRVNSMEAAKRVKLEGKSNDLVMRLAKDKNIPLNKDDLRGIVNDASRFTGLAGRQVEEFLKNHLEPVLLKHKNLLNDKVDSRVKV